MPVAVKRLHLEASDAAHRELTIAQGLAGKQFEHVMPILDAGQDADSDAYFVVMPVADHNLDEYRARIGRIPETEAIEILLQIATGIEAISHIVHRDLKPANVLMCDGQWCIADFGIARFVENSTSARTLKDCLSPYFAAPEQWSLEHCTPATDVYALGGIAHVLLTGRTPFEGSQAELQRKHLSEAPPEIADASPQLKTLVAMMLRKAPAARPTVSRVKSVLQQAARSMSSGADPSLHRLAGAGAAHEQRTLEAEAERYRRATIEVKRGELAMEASSILRSLYSALAKRIADAVPNARVEHSEASWSVQIGGATLEMEFGHRSVIHEEAFPKSGWDVVCSGAIEVRQVLPVHKRGASLWYTRQKSRMGEYRWYEVGYTANPLTGKMFEFEPTALDVELADRAHWAAMDVVQTAYAPVAIDDEDAESFFRRWAHIFAIASEGRLKSLPSSLPTP